MQATVSERQNGRYAHSCAVPHSRHTFDATTTGAPTSSRDRPSLENRMFHIRTSRLAVAASITLGLVGGLTGNAASVAGADTPGPGLRSGERAIAALGDRIDHAAKQLHMTPSALKQTLL